MKVLFVLDHAPDYREAFLRYLGSKCNLIVVAQPCKWDNLKPPKLRSGYRYIELSKSYGKTIRFNFELRGIIKLNTPDIICVALNLRHPFRIINFLSLKKYRKRWIWWGQIFGNNDFTVLVNLKKLLIKKSAGCLVYTEDIVERLNIPNVISFDNSQFAEKDYVKLTNNLSMKTFNCLFVGRPQARKRLEMLFDLTSKYDFIKIRLVGPGMKSFFQSFPEHKNIKLFEGATGLELQEHFSWSNLVINPGHVGLLVMNAACHNRPIVIDSEVDHAPEVILAKQANQYFIDFTNEETVNCFFNDLLKNPKQLVEKGEEIFFVAKTKYTIEKMATKHMDMFVEVMDK